MAQVNQRLWKLPGQRTKRKAWGFTAQINGKQVRRYKAEWTWSEVRRIPLDPVNSNIDHFLPGIGADPVSAARCRGHRLFWADGGFVDMCCSTEGMPFS